jgi:hypothetical protein
MFQSRTREMVTAPGRHGPSVRPGGTGPASVPPIALVDQRRQRWSFQPIVMADAPSRHTLRAGFLRLLTPEGHSMIPPATGRVRSAGGRVDLGARPRHGQRSGWASRPCAATYGPSARRPRLGALARQRRLGAPPWRRGCASLGPRLVLVMEEGSATILADRMARAMAELRPHGVSFVLDDFGNGPLSFRQLQELCFAGVKIDHSLVRGRRRLVAAAGPDRRAGQRGAPPRHVRRRQGGGDGGGGSAAPCSGRGRPSGLPVQPPRSPSLRRGACGATIRGGALPRLAGAWTRWPAACRQLGSASSWVFLPGPACPLPSAGLASRPSSNGRPGGRHQGGIRP